MEPTFQLAGVTVTPLNVTMLDPWVDPKLTPVIVTRLPTVADAGDKLLMTGPAVTENQAQAVVPPTLIATRPVVAPIGTATVIDELLQLIGVATAV
jgi:hypothetical protein